MSVSSVSDDADDLEEDEIAEADDTMAMESAGVTTPLLFVLASLATFSSLRGRLLPALDLGAKNDVIMVFRAEQ